ncbi:hypothetical protein DD237_002306 [Peronospora effusa]|uniref:Uncharacterized protein n=1 Tax=Peronospora effusa TaxID=542832 RepID=A0A3R7W3Q5_9STRA|nr:hypothetical protein DD237_002306 [Peronospora effusa]
MGLRSRHRRLAGITQEEAYDPETTCIHTQSLEEHLQASIHNVDAFNLIWKRTLGHAGLVVITYEIFLWFQLLTDNSSTLRWTLALALKFIAIGSILCMREHVRTGHRQYLDQGLFYSSSYVLIWLCCSMLLHFNLSVMEISPLCIVYCILSILVLQLVGDNTKAEVARAQQLAKLHRLMVQ